MRFYTREQDGHEWLASDEPFVTPYHVEKAYSNLSHEEQQLFDKVCERLPTAESFIRTHAARYGWNEQLLRLARPMHPRKLAHPVSYLTPHWHCFENSFARAQRTGLFYVEGIAVGPHGALIHGWNSLRGTDVLDYTWPHQHLNHYFGIVLDVKWMEQNSPVPCGILAHLHEETCAGVRNGHARVTIQKFLADHVSVPAS